MTVGPVRTQTRTVSAAPKPPAWVSAEMHGTTHQWADPTKKHIFSSAPSATPAPTPPAWQNTNPNWKPTYATYGQNKWSSAPHAVDAVTLANQQDDSASAASDVKAAIAQKAAQVSSDNALRTQKFNEFARASNTSYLGAMGSFGGAGMGRNAGTSQVLSNNLIQSESDQRAALNTTLADRELALEHVINEAKRRQGLITDSHNRHNTLIGSDPAALIRSVTQ